MKKNLMLVLGLSSIILLAGCGGNKVENTDSTDQESNIVSNEHPDWVKTSLTLEDLEHIEETLPPLSYHYDVYDKEASALVYSGDYEVNDGEEPVFFIPEYENMASREVVSSEMRDGFIYTVTKFTAKDGYQFDVLYVNEPDTLFCRVINVEEGTKTALYSNFIYESDIN